MPSGKSQRYFSYLFLLILYFILTIQTEHIVDQSEARVNNVNIVLTVFLLTSNDILTVSSLFRVHFYPAALR
jgi:hypothetical protein